MTTAGAPVMSGIDDSDGDADGEHGFGAHAGSHAGGGAGSSCNAAKFSDEEDDEDADLHDGVEGVAFDGSHVKEEGRDSSDVTGSMGTHFDTSSSSMGVNSNTSASTSNSPIEDGKENHKPSLSTTTAPTSSGSGSGLAPNEILFHLLFLLKTLLCLGGKLVTSMTARRRGPRTLSQKQMTETFFVCL